MTTPIVPRDPDVDLTKVPRHWLFGNATATAIANGVNLLFPHGERFFVRSVKHYLEQIDDPLLRQQIKGFFGQEGRHAHHHDEFNDVLRAQGFEIDRFLTSYKKISSWLEEHLPPSVNLAITAAAEHFTATLAEGAFKEHVLDAADPAMQKLLAWHAAEEIEHKAVAYDVLQQVDPSYPTRVAGLALATAILGGFWTWAAIVLARQDGMSARKLWTDRTTLKQRDPIVRRVFLRGIRAYLRRDFHPRDQRNETLAAEWFAARGMTLPEAA